RDVVTGSWPPLAGGDDVSPPARPSSAPGTPTAAPPELKGMLAAAETELPTVQELLERLRQVLQAEALSLHGPEGFALRVGRSVLDGSGGEEVRLALSLPDGAPPHTLGITGQERSRMGAIDPDRLRAELELLRNTLAQQHLREEGARQ